MSVIKNNNKHLAYNEDEPPQKKIMSEADILIKDLTSKQLNKHINFQECLKQEKNFEKLSEHISFTNHCSGTLSLQNFKKAVEQLEYIEDLKSCNLSNDDVKLILDYKNGKTFEKYSNIEPNVLQSRIQRILDLIKEFKQKSEDECKIKKKNITHKQNEALAAKPDSLETKLLKFALENKSESSDKIPHPMDNIKCMEKDLFSHLYEKKLNPSKVQKQIRKFANRISTSTLPENSQTSENKLLKQSEEYYFVNNSKWDKEISEPVPKTSSKTKIYSCKPQNFYTIRDGQIVKLNSGNLKKNIDIQKIEKLTVDEIKEIPKFGNYDLGSPSNVLYLKNLPKCIKELDLDEVFSEFTLNNKLLIRVMTGKMRGQAFVTFPNVETASEALEKLNGILLDQKPLVIQFGKKI